MKSDRELELEAELELSSLQINQLQEELEHSYLECSRLKQQESENSSTASQIPALVLLTESRVNDSRYSESGFCAKAAFLLSQISQLRQALESSLSENAILEQQVSDRDNLQCQVEQLTVDKKLLIKSLVDLDDLRASFAEKVASEQELVELVNQLRESLALASRYYSELQKEHPEILLPAKKNL